jgi:hypothetical protein
MALKVIGSGLGRTGTASLKQALETLGFKPCHHMIEVFMHVETQPSLWHAALTGNPDWDAIYDGYQAAVDYPTGAVWRELVVKYPQAKVLHSTRDPEEWFESTQATIFAPRGPAELPPPPVRPMFEALFGRIGIDIHDKKAMIAYFHRNEEDVKREIPKERLLVYNAAEGWAPLCKFLAVPVPDAPFPRVNTRDEFRTRVANRDVVTATQEEVKKLGEDFAQNR